jgi:hypothetical protein
MTDVRLTALNPEDSKVYPVACNTSGELRLEKQATFDGYLDGDLTVTGKAFLNRAVGIGTDDPKATLHITGDFLMQSGSTYLCNCYYGNGQWNYLDESRASGYINLATTGNSLSFGYADPGESLEERICVKGNGNVGIATADPQATLDVNGGAEFAGDVVVGSRNKLWMLVEQGGLCHMVEEVRATTADLVDPSASAVAEYPKLRDVFAELNVIEKALEEVMEKLRMTEPDGWPVWDGSDNSR